MGKRERVLPVLGIKYILLGPSMRLADGTYSALQTLYFITVGLESQTSG